MKDFTFLEHALSRTRGQLKLLTTLFAVSLTAYVVYHNAPVLTDISLVDNNVPAFTDSSLVDNSHCQGQVKLPTLAESGADFSESVFVLETSGRGVLESRQACAVESAVERTDYPVIVLLRSEFLDTSENTTCQLYLLSKRITEVKPKLTFVKIELDIAFNGTPFQNLKFVQGNHYITHLSDSLRAAYLYNFGGWYFDLDFVFIKSLNGLKDSPNILAATRSSAKIKNPHITNAMLKFGKKHPLILEYIRKSVSKYKAKPKARTAMGPMTVTEAVRSVCYLDKKFPLVNISAKHHRCLNLTVVNPDLFHPIKPYETQRLWPKNATNPNEWEKAFEKSFAVHFFSFVTKGKLVKRLPTYEAYGYLGKKYCPLSYYSVGCF